LLSTVSIGDVKIYIYKTKVVHTTQMFN